MATLSSEVATLSSEIAILSSEIATSIRRAALMQAAVGRRVVYWCLPTALRLRALRWFGGKRGPSAESLTPLPERGVPQSDSEHALVVDTTAGRIQSNTQPLASPFVNEGQVFVPMWTGVGGWFLLALELPRGNCSFSPDEEAGSVPSPRWIFDQQLLWSPDVTRA